ncbi:RNA polymerase sigma factor [Pararhodobacter sp. SW119]|uniref:RNA polymerase sigma factor n=1 Tax=Pararhodobacter sp. SW119 TaxID=2780075 RepID=UPI001ADF132B|nr:RNA polymerase sigma factor [Pararhodobacter sp. SW119]
MRDAASPTDEALLQRYATGDPEAARILLDRLAPRLYRLAQRLLADPTEAEDVVQEAMLKLWKIAPDWQSGAAQPGTWVYRVAMNLATDRLRRRRSVALDSVPEPADGAPPPLQAMLDADRGRALNAALAQLPDRQRQAVVLRHLEGLSNPEIAAQMDIGVEAVESLTARGKRRLAELLAPRRTDLGYDT